MSILEVKNLYYSLSQRAIIEDFNLIVNPGEILTLFGPSGCGKSTFLKLVSGILRPSDGKINLNSKIAYMFQEHRLFENLSAYENIALVMQKEDSKWIYEMLNELGITSLDAKRYPAELSGGMRARVAFVRTMAANARLILLDEPFSGLDFAMREILISKLQNIVKERDASVILVTHDAYEACKVSNKILFLSAYGMRVEKSLNIDRKNLDENAIKSLFNSEFKGRIYFD